MPLTHEKSRCFTDIACSTLAIHDMSNSAKNSRPTSSAPFPMRSSACPVPRVSPPRGSPRATPSDCLCSTGYNGTDGGPPTNTGMDHSPCLPCPASILTYMPDPPDPCISCMNIELCSAINKCWDGRSQIHWSRSDEEVSFRHKEKPVA